MGLQGLAVSLGVHCCTAPPSDSNLISTVQAATVGPGIEFPAIGTTGPTVINADVDVSSDRIDIHYLVARNASAGTFNGYLLAFSLPADAGSSPVTVASASLNPMTSFASGVVVTHDVNTVLINVASLRIPADSRIVVDLTLTTSP